jgi:hypothetical protein
MPEAKYTEIGRTYALRLGSEYWTLKEEQEKRIETAEMHFIRAVAGNRKIEHTFNGYIRRKLVTTATRMMMTMIQFN